VNEQMLAKPSARRIIEAIPPNQILTETDGPFVQSKGHPVKPGQVNGAIEALSKILNYSLSQTQKLILKNLAELEQHA
jgi:TatD DNase family protein